MEPTVQRRSAGPLEGSHDLACVLGAENAGFLVGAQVQCSQALDGQVEEIQRITDPASLHQFFGNNSPERLDVESLTLSEVFHAPGQLRRASSHILAAPSHLVLVAIRDLFFGDGTAASRAFTPDMPHQIEHFRIGRPQRGEHFGHLGNHHAGFADHDGITDADILPANLVLVVQRGPGHRRSLDEHRLQLGHRRQNTGTSHLHRDGQKPRLCWSDPRHWLVDDGITGSAPLVGNPRGIVKAIHLDDHAIDFVGQLATQVPVLIVSRHDRGPVDAEQLVHPATSPPAALNRQSPRLVLTQHFGMTFKTNPFARPHRIEDGTDGALGHHPRIQQFQGA